MRIRVPRAKRIQAQSSPYFFWVPLFQTKQRSQDNLLLPSKGAVLENQRSSPPTPTNSTQLSSPGPLTTTLINTRSYTGDDVALLFTSHEATRTSVHNRRASFSSSARGTPKTHHDWPRLLPLAKAATTMSSSFV
ncbi:hypothetical protein DEO72_LG4g584 [Vigna unguiculata]|uniref:Uncharacterized protein n=1 Tax=Vigna unguiculata TaxID=3917 RepID=A0A4D6LME4_VIGUN|nr:hypothetical protein DEO72_LG4g584 [Vigna unguiculata]